MQKCGGKLGERIRLKLSLIWGDGLRFISKRREISVFWKLKEAFVLFGKNLGEVSAIYPFCTIFDYFEILIKQLITLDEPKCIS